MSDGYVVAAPGQHPGGGAYSVAEDFGWNTVNDLPEAPPWVTALLAEARRKQDSAPAFDGTVAIAELDGQKAYERIAALLPDDVRLLTENGPTALTSTTSDFSRADFHVAAALYRAGATPQEIVAIFTSFPIGMEGKYARRLTQSGAEAAGKYIADTVRHAIDDVEASKSEEAALSNIVKDEHEGSRDSGLRQLMELTEDVEFFHSDEKAPFARVWVNGHWEVLAVQEEGFREWLQREAWSHFQLVPTRNQLDGAVGTASARARYDGPTIPVAMRIAKHGGTTYVDLGNDDWTLVEITPDGWEVVRSDDLPVRFHRAAGMRALPTPQRGGDLSQLRKHLNVENASWPLLVAWLLMAYHPAGPYPVLNLVGEQGTAKTTTAEMLRQLVDPAAASVRGEPRKEDDIMVAVSKNRVLVFDNLSRMPSWLSDTLCRVATGTSFATRKFYTNTDEVVVTGARPIILTGISDVVTRGDLLDRSIFVTLRPISGEQRLPLATVRERFEAATPMILGALFDAVSMALSRYHSVTLSTTPRMADFTQWVVAAEGALPWPEGAFLRAYEANRRDAIEAALEADVLTDEVMRLMRDRKVWSGTATELLRALNETVPFDKRRTDTWPKTPAHLSGRLFRLNPALRTRGIEFDRKKSGSRNVTLTRIAFTTSDTGGSPGRGGGRVA
jgi:hypothetical protein